VGLWPTCGCRKWEKNDKTLERLAADASRPKTEKIEQNSTCGSRNSKKMKNIDEEIMN